MRFINYSRDDRFRNLHIEHDNAAKSIYGGLHFMGLALVPMIYGTFPGGILVSFMGPGRWPPRVFLPIECPINHVGFPSKGFVSARTVAAPPKVVISGENLRRSNMKIIASLHVVEDFF